jgi:ATP-dependent DNA helicase RecQ
LRYFGEVNAPRCGRCDVCLQRNKLNLNEIEFETIQDNIRNLLERGPMTLPELVFDAGPYGEQHVLTVLRWLQERGAVILDEHQRYTWRKQFRLKV